VPRRLTVSRAQCIVQVRRHGQRARHPRRRAGPGQRRRRVEHAGQPLDGGATVEAGGAQPSGPPRASAARRRTAPPAPLSPSPLIAPRDDTRPGGRWRRVVQSSSMPPPATCCARTGQRSPRGGLGACSARTAGAWQFSGIEVAWRGGVTGRATRRRRRWRADAGERILADARPTWHGPRRRKWRYALSLRGHAVPVRHRVGVVRARRCVIPLGGSGVVGALPRVRVVVSASALPRCSANFQCRQVCPCRSIYCSGGGR
jgi:hypothetical protein